MPKIRTNKGLLFACSSGDYAYLEQYIKRHQSKEKYEIYDNHRFGPLHHAVVSNSIECVRALLTIKSLNTRNQSYEGNTALLLAIEKPVSIEIVRLLIDNDPELINIPNNEEEYPMHIAVRLSKIDVVKTMVESLKEKHLKIQDHVDLDMETSLMLASRNKDLNMISYLLNNTECDCKRLSDNNVNAFTITAMYRIPDGMKEQTIAILEKLLPLTYDLDPNNIQMCEELLLPISLSWSFQNFDIVDWFVDKFYLCNENGERTIVQRLLHEFKENAEDYNFYNILFALHSNIKNVILGEPVELCIQTLLWADVYQHFFKMFLPNRNLFVAISNAFLPKFTEVPSKVVISSFSNFFVGYVKIFQDNFMTNPIRGITDYKYDRSVCLEFLNNFQVHTDIGIESIILSAYVLTFYVNLPENAKQNYLTELFALLLPFYVGNSREHLWNEFFDEVPQYFQGPEPERMIMDDTTRQIMSDFNAKEKMPKTLFDLCRTEIRQSVFNKNNRIIINPDEKLNSLMSLHIPLKVKNLLRYNDTNYLIH